MLEQRCGYREGAQRLVVGDEAEQEGSVACLLCQGVCILSLSKWEPARDFKQTLDTFSNLLSKLFVLIYKKTFSKMFLF